MELLGSYSHDLRSFLDKDRITYTSHEPQTELIKCITEEVRQEIQRPMDNSRFVLVMMDDTSDTSNVADTGILLQTLQKYKVPSETSRERLVGQSYDGVATMSGELNGVLRQIQGHFPAAYYKHCVVHRMSLCASWSTSKIPQVAKFSGTTDRLISFFSSSAKWTRHLGFKLPKPGHTRWLSRDFATSVIDSCYEIIGTVLYELSNVRNEKAETQTSARGLCIQMQQVQFVFLLKLYRKVFEHCTPINDCDAEANIRCNSIKLDVAWF